MRRALIIFPAFFLLFSPLVAQTIADFLSVPFPSDLQANGSGTALAWIFNDKGERNVFYAEGPGFTPRKLTDFKGDNGLEINNLFFSADGKFLVFVRGNGSNNNGEPANPAQLQESTARMLYAIDLTRGSLRKIGAGTSPRISPDGKMVAYLSSGQVWIAGLSDTTQTARKLFQARGSQSQLRWSPDGKRLAFQSQRGDHAFIGVYDLPANQVFFPDPSADIDGYPTWSPDGSRLAYIRVAPVQFDLPFTPKSEAYPWQIRVLEVSTGVAQEVWRAEEGKGSVFNEDLPASDTRLLWPNASTLLFPWEKTGWLHIYALDLQKKTLHDLTPGEGEVEGWKLSNDANSLFFTSNHGDIDRRHIWTTPLSVSKPSCLTPGRQIEWSPVELKTGLAFIHSSATRPAWPALLSQGRRQDLAPSLFPQMFPRQMPEPQAVKVNAPDGFVSYGQLFLPAGTSPGKKHPAVIFLHGGSRRQMLLGFNYGQYYSHAYALNQYFASRGYVVLSLNYRSGIGYGLDFREAPNYGAAGASEVRDLIGAAHFLAARTDVDPSKISMWGGSYGGYLTAHGLAQRSELFLCGVDIHGVHNWNDEIPTFAPWYNPLDYPEAAHLAFESSPERYVEGWKDPVLFIHGDDDRNVPFRETVRIQEKLRRQGVPCEQLIFPDEVHSFLLHRNWINAYEATFRFIDRYSR